MDDREKRAREWYAWEKERNRERRIRFFAGCILACGIALALWFAIGVVGAAVVRWLQL